MGEPTWRAEVNDAQLRGELDRVHPERVRLRPCDLAGMKEAMDLVDQMWTPNSRPGAAFAVREVPSRVDGEYSFVETLRHLLFAGDAWLRRMVLHGPDPFHEWGVPPNPPAHVSPDTGPALEDVVSVREARQYTSGLISRPCQRRIFSST